MSKIYALFQTKAAQNSNSLASHEGPFQTQERRIILPHLIHQTLKKRSKQFSASRKTGIVYKHVADLV